VPKYPVLDTPWLTTNFDAGDTLFFPALTIHKAMPNLTEDRMRISLDNRYEGEGDAIAAHMLAPHLNDVTPISWEEVYADWKTDDLKYYWRRMTHREIPRYLGYMKKGFQEALELAGHGDPRAILALRRVVTASPGSEDGKAALTVLAAIDASGTAAPLDAPRAGQPG
jgi:hypothetical protein